ncbi:hypothetical protein B0H17DRAFT_1134511 [Mycena rosella]|uniref:Uncharacterized protein n=1 Tax=Mycena rosella TaxID=1033263 RepID=A0AAD7GI78_MYCRO|nr:hypothetical protein B0H17DRAFT_1134511 [Mycena rosella]
MPEAMTQCPRKMPEPVQLSRASRRCSINLAVLAQPRVHGGEAPGRTIPSAKCTGNVRIAAAGALGECSRRQHTDRKRVPLFRPQTQRPLAPSLAPPQPTPPSPMSPLKRHSSYAHLSQTGCGRVPAHAPAPRPLDATLRPVFARVQTAAPAPPAPVKPSPKTTTSAQQNKVTSPVFTTFSDSHDEFSAEYRRGKKAKPPRASGSEPTAVANDGMLLDVVPNFAPAIHDPTADVKFFFALPVMMTGARGSPKLHRNCKLCKRDIVADASTARRHLASMHNRNDATDGSHKRWEKHVGVEGADDARVGISHKSLRMAREESGNRMVRLEAPMKEVGDFIRGHGWAQRIVR